MTQTDIETLKNGDVLQVNGTNFVLVYRIADKSIHVIPFRSNGFFCSDPYKLLNFQVTSNYTEIVEDRAKENELYHIFGPGTKCHVCPNNESFLWKEFLELDSTNITPFYKNFDHLNFVVETCYWVQSDFYAIVVEPYMELRAIVKASALVPNDFPIGLYVEPIDHQTLMYWATCIYGANKQEAKSIVNTIETKQTKIIGFDSMNYVCTISVDGYDFTISSDLLKPKCPKFGDQVWKFVFKSKNGVLG